MTTFSLLYVCTGNICRSPMAERITRQLLLRQTGQPRVAGCAASAADPIVVASSGTWAQTGSPMTPFAAAALLEYGADPEGFTARELTADQVVDADLVLTATVEHRAAVVGLVPSAVRRTFTLLEFARLVSPGLRGHDGAGPVDAAERARAVVAEVLVRRGVGPQGEPGADDIDDPYGAALQVYRERLREIAEAVDQVVAALVPS